MFGGACFQGSDSERDVYMNAKQELAGRIMLLICDEIKPDTRRVLDVLSEYRVDHSTGIEEMEFMRQVNHFLAAKKSEGLSPRSEENYRLYLSMFNDYTGKKATEVTATDIRDFIIYFTDVRHNKNSSAQSVINVLRSFFGWMHLEEFIPKNPTIKIKNFKIDKKDARHPLTTEQLELLRNACSNYREKALLEFLYSSGCRLSEATQIDVDGIYFEQRSVPTVGKGGKRRTLYFSVRARLMIRRYLEERKGGMALFCSCRQPYQRLSGAAVQRIIRMLGEKAGMSRRIHPHVLRHTLASDLLNSGMDISAISRILGHGSVDTTEIYAELNQDSVRREYEKYIA